MSDKEESPEQAKAALDKVVQKLSTAPDLADDTTEKPAESASTEAASEKNSVAVPKEDAQTEKAVDEIMKMDGDDALQAQDEAAEVPTIMKTSKWERFKNWNAEWWHNPKKRWASIAVIMLVLAGVFAWPLTRYNILGLVLKSSVTVRAVDSKTGAPVSGAKVELSGKTAETQADGKATFKTNMGSGSLSVSKKYYTGYTHGELVQSDKNSFKATLVATGRQVKIKLVNKVTGAGVSGASVTAGGAKTKTDKQGLATLVIPSGADVQAAKITVAGYNTASVTLTADGNLAKNTFSLVPGGKIYFLSNLSGTIDVVKANLDGSDRQTVLAGTGKEDRGSTSLLASRDWKYLALLSKRAGDNASVYLIDTTNNDKLSTIDEGNANFSLVGWSGDRFVYQVTRNTVGFWQANHLAIKSFDPTTGHTLLLDQSQGSGTSANDYITQSFGSPYLMGDQIIYVKNWVATPANASQLGDKQAELDSIGADGSGHKVIKSFSGASGTQINYLLLQTILYEPEGLYLQFSDDTGSSYFKYDDSKVTPDTQLNDANFFETPYPTFLLSPSSNSTFWADQRDGKNTLFTGDQDAKTPKQIASLSDYNAYAWYTDNYVLVSKNSSELYIMGASGGTPLKITDYYKPTINYRGYGGGYGGL
jgi:hypothetical protein